MQCKAFTKTGTQCKNTPVKGSEYCHIEAHQGQGGVDKIRHPKKAAMIQALESTLGVVTTACQKVGINRQTHYNWLDSDEAYRKAVDELNNVALDFAESQLFKQVKDGSTVATIFLLKTRGKSRGYIERQEHEHTGKDGGPIETKNVVLYLPDNDRDDTDN